MVLMHRSTDCCIESNGTTTSLTRPGSQYAASSRIITSPETPFNDCDGGHSGARARGGTRVSAG